MGENHSDKELGHKLCGPSLKQSHKNTMVPMEAVQMGWIVFGLMGNVWTPIE